MITKSEIKKLFLKSNKISEIKSNLRANKFKSVNHGANKWVFISKELPWVVKLCYGSEYQPRKNSAIEKFYLPPTKVASKCFQDGYRVELLFQPKCITTNSYNIFDKFMESLPRQAEWDSGPQNIGFYKGKWWIIDY